LDEFTRNAELMHALKIEGERWTIKLRSETGLDLALERMVRLRKRDTNSRTSNG
jgi:hypothetical protein